MKPVHNGKKRIKCKVVHKSRFILNKTIDRCLKCGIPMKEGSWDLIFMHPGCWASCEDFLQNDITSKVGMSNFGDTLIRWI